MKPLYAYLQFRRMCELIALGCLQLHGNLPQVQTSDAKKIWNAEKIMRLLKKVHPVSFPQSVVRDKLDANHHRIQAQARPNALTYKGFNELYAKCGEVLHRGTIKSLEASGAISDDDYRKVTEWQSKIVDLMNEHMVGRQMVQATISSRSELWMGILNVRTRPTTSLGLLHQHPTVVALEHPHISGELRYDLAASVRRDRVFFACLHPQAARCGHLQVARANISGFGTLIFYNSSVRGWRWVGD
jgi:hypothetical protein